MTDASLGKQPYLTEKISRLCYLAATRLARPTRNKAGVTAAT